MEGIVADHIYPFNHHCYCADSGQGQDPVKEYAVTEKGPAPTEGGHSVAGHFEKRLASAHKYGLGYGQDNQSEHKTTAMALSEPGNPEASIFRVRSSYQPTRAVSISPRPIWITAS